ncbi:MAG: hypothetical protein AAF409_02700 [Pseudomonadota bacterium]
MIGRLVVGGGGRAILPGQGAPGSPAEVVLEQDHCIGPDHLDIARWTATVFFPLVMVSSTGTLAIDDAEAFAAHLEELRDTAGRGRGMAGFRTRITSEITPAENIAIVGSYRDHVDAAGDVITSSSITWSLIRSGGAWKINQIHFNDARQDPSVVSDICRAKGERE